MSDQLPSRLPGRREPEPVDDVVKTTLQGYEQVLTRQTGNAGSPLKQIAELLLSDAVDALHLLLFPQLNRILGLPATATTPTVLTGRVSATLDTAFLGEAAFAFKEELLPFATAEPAGWTYMARHQTLRFFGGRQPLCGIGVTSLIERIVSPAAWSAWIADSRPEPGPCTCTCTRFMPNPTASFAAVSAAIVAANGVDFFEPLKPAFPALAHAMVSPFVVAIVMIVLLNVALI
jgi:hypothetical protein